MTILINKGFIRLLTSILMVHFVFTIGCSKKSPVVPPKPQPKPETEMSYIQTDKEVYHFGDAIKLAVFSIKNTSKTNVDIVRVTAKIKNFSNNNFGETVLAENVKIAVGKEHQIGSKTISEVSSYFKKESYGIYIEILFADKSIKETYKTFFRIYDDKKQVVYKIAKTQYRGLPVFTLKDGLSAEYAVQKSAASFISGISHSWYPKLQPIASTPGFLERSINQTVNFYNTVIGSSTPIETVIISTGIPAVPYLARAMNAIVLPLHYLTGAGSVKEVQTILEYANQNGYAAYGTLGYDYSISTTTGVAWIKLLDLPGQYKKFMIEHQVKNVVLYGHTGFNDGETVARKVVDKGGKYEKGALCLMHFSGGASEGYLKQVISDYNDTQLAEEIRIADWEAGIISEQIENFTASIKLQTPISTIVSVTANKGVHLWNMGTFATLAFIHKNRAKFEMNGAPIRGISLNPYLIAHPTYESWIGYIPFLYWQGFSPEFQYNNWLSTKIKKAVNAYFPDVVFENLNFWVNTTRNFGGAERGNQMANFLISKGLNVQQNDFNSDEVWNLADGINAPSEVRAKQLLDKVKAKDYKNWNATLQYLTTDDLKAVSDKFPEIKINVYQ